jgi:hypothetical protein
MKKYTFQISRTLEEKISYLLRNTSADSIDTLFGILIEKSYKNIKSGKRI